jgi:PAS domain S-box-containing protein
VEAATRENVERFHRALDDLLEGCQIIGSDWKYLYVNAAAARHARRSKEELVGRTMTESYPGIERTDLFRVLEHCMRTRSAKLLENEFTYPDGDKQYFELSIQPVPEGLFILSIDVTERKRAEQESQKRLKELEALHRISSALRSAETAEEALPILLDQTLAVLGTEAGIIWLFDPENNELNATISRGWFSSFEEAPIRPGEGIAGTVFESGRVHFSREFVQDPIVRASAREHIPAGWGGTCVPIRAGATAVGVLFVSVQLPRELTTDEMSLLNSLAEMAGAALHRMRLHAETVRRLSHLQALQTVDQAITTSLSLRLTLDVLLEQTIGQLGVHAAGVLLLDPRSNVLEHAAGRNFKTAAYERSSVHLGAGTAGCAALERRTKYVAALAQSGADFTRAALLADEGFVSYFGAPLIAKGQVKGVLEVFHRDPLRPAHEWVNFFETLARQAAIAIDSAQLFESLQRSTLELTVAYDATIEGWSRALDMRDRETEGHTRRVTDLTVRLARAMGIGNDEIVHIGRGALLHDIGKMGVPDGILLKPGPLTDGEWEIIRRHPRHAYELLAPIAFLRPSLSIPYCHHERWDGTGYPRGLKGEAIPQPARIFAVADVWDAITSDRPYRSATPCEQALEYIRAQSGKAFDPKVVNVFLEQIAHSTTVNISR